MARRTPRRRIRKQRPERTSQSAVRAPRRVGRPIHRSHQGRSRLSHIRPSRATHQLTDPGSANAPPRFGWLGGAQRSGETLAGTLLMGSRVYAPGIGRFLSIDPTPGGNAGVYDYCTADPINCTDLTGNWPDWGAVLNVVAVVAETVATIVPGPIGTAAGFISAGAYLATGNTSKATEMAITATAQLVGAGLAAKAAIKAVQYASKIGRAVTGAVKSARAAVAESRVGRATERTSARAATASSPAPS